MNDLIGVWNRIRYFLCLDFMMLEFERCHKQQILMEHMIRNLNKRFAFYGLLGTLSKSSISHNFLCEIIRKIGINELRIVISTFSILVIITEDFRRKKQFRKVTNNKKLKNKLEEKSQQFSCGKTIKIIRFSENNKNQTEKKLFSSERKAEKHNNWGIPIQ